MKTSTQIPPVYERCRKLFNVSWDGGIAIVYGDTLHAKNVDMLGPDVLAHEKVHVQQQGILGPEAWWDKYLSDPKFRLQEEKEAFLAQWRYYKMNVDDKKLLEKCRLFIIKELSGATYGHLISAAEVNELLK